MAAVVAEKANGTTPEGPPCHNRGKESAHCLNVIHAKKILLPRGELPFWLLTDSYVDDWPSASEVYAALNGKI